MKNLKYWTSTAIVIAGSVALVWDIIWTTTGNASAWIAYFTCIALVLTNLKGMTREITAWKARR